MSANANKPGFNPWPYSIIAFFSIAIAAAAVWIVFCIGHGTDLVATDYYEQELQYQDKLDSMQRVEELAGKASVTYNTNAEMIEIQLPPEQAASNPEGVIYLYRPSQARLDQHLPLQVTAAGEQRLDARVLAPGRWDVRVQWKAQGKEFFLNEKLNIARRVL